MTNIELVHESLPGITAGFMFLYMNTKDGKWYMYEALQLLLLTYSGNNLVKMIRRDKINEELYISYYDSSDLAYS